MQSSMANIKPEIALSNPRGAAVGCQPRAQVREALRELEWMGFLETHPFSGTFVKEHSAADLQEIYTVPPLYWKPWAPGWRRRS